MRRRLCLISACAVLAPLVATQARAGDRYGPPVVVKKQQPAPVYSGPLLSWNAKAAPAPAAASAAPTPLSDWARRAQAQRAPAPVQAAPARLPASLYDPPAPSPSPAPAPAAAAAPMAYQPAHPTGQPIEISPLAFSGPSLERQQAAEDDAAVLAAKMARAQQLAARQGAGGQANTTTDLLGGP